MRKFLTRHLYIFSICLLAACGPTSADKKVLENSKYDTTTASQSDVSTDAQATEDTTNQDIVTYYVVIADTGLDYSHLRGKMFDLNNKLNIPIDTMGRFYNQVKNLIALPDNDEDEIYAGDYFPRRFPSHNLSLEYLALYHRDAGEKTIALVTGIYETEKSADSALTVLKEAEKKVFKVKADIYVGCMH
jgi:hypothetical protein